MNEGEMIISVMGFCIVFGILVVTLYYALIANETLRMKENFCKSNGYTYDNYGKGCDMCWKIVNDTVERRCIEKKNDKIYWSGDLK